MNEQDARAVAEGIVSLWVNNRDDKGAVAVQDRLLLGTHLPSACSDLVDRITDALAAERQRQEAARAGSATLAIDALERAEVAEIDLRRSEAARAGLVEENARLHRLLVRVDGHLSLLHHRGADALNASDVLELLRAVEVETRTAATAGTPSAPPGKLKE